MWERNGQHSERMGQARPIGREGQTRPEEEPSAADAHATAGPLGALGTGDTLAAERLGTGDAVGDGALAPPPGQDPVQWQRAQTRQLIREFLRSVPRAEPEATLTFVRADGTVRLLTRAQISAAIDRMRPRMRQIMRLALEECWPRQRVCVYLHNISIKTLERDQVEALDLLAEL
ncbi:MAG: hypothetical protein IVW57_17715 [Ktedonobacterales bacterium]|nr:hypothetical protein [Ktedonobacterales bacterium]